METLTKTSSLDHVTSTLFRTADRKNCAQSRYTSSQHPPRRRTSMREETLAIIPRLGATAPMSSTMTSSEKGYALSLTSKGALFILSLLLQDSWHSPHSPTIPSLASPTSNVGCVEKLAALEVSQNFVVTMSQNDDVFTTNAATNMALFCRNICDPSHKKRTKITGTPRLLHFISSFELHLSPEYNHFTFVAACVAGVTQTRINT